MLSPYVLRQAASAPRPAGDEQYLAGMTPASLSRLIHEQHFDIVFQPVIRLADRTIDHYEALLRLRPPARLTSIPTRMLVLTADQFGLGPMLDEAVLCSVPSVSDCVSINIHPASLTKSAIIDRALAYFSDKNRKLIIELIRNESPTDLSMLAAAVDRLRGAGIKVALDEVDGDARSLALVQAVQFDVLKIAGAVVRAASGGERGRRLLAALVRLSRTIGARMVAKQVETLPQAWAMEVAGVELAQGWLFGVPRPLPCHRDSA
jgi:EAL domain-containing protein (putative c-di-GMP-specific phosphodiesterase class I)